MAMGYYSMTLVWDIKTKFIFATFVSSEVWHFVLGCLVSFGVGVLTLSLPNLKERATKNRKPMKDSSASLMAAHEIDFDQTNKPVITTVTSVWCYRLIVIAFSFLIGFFQTTLMLLIMTMNGYVILCILLGLVLGFFVNYTKPPSTPCCKSNH